MARRARTVLLKVSGESLSGRGGTGIDPDALNRLAREIASLPARGLRLGVVVGGGNFIRGGQWTKQVGVVDQATADYMGMIATILNAMALQAALEALGRPTRVVSAIQVRQACEPYIRRRALRHLEKGRVVIFAGGTGNPFFTTDTAAVLRALEISADLLLKATKVAGVYDKDPASHRDAKLYSKLSFDEVLKQRLRIMDMTAFTLCQENKLPILVVDVFKPGNMKRALAGGRLGTVITP